MCWQQFRPGVTLYLMELDQEVSLSRGGTSRDSSFEKCSVGLRYYQFRVLSRSRAQAHFSALSQRPRAARRLANWFSYFFAVLSADRKASKFAEDSCDRSIKASG